MVVTAMFSQTYYYKGPISTHFLDNADVSAVAGLIVGGGVYWLLCGPLAARQSSRGPRARAAQAAGSASPAKDAT